MKTLYEQIDELARELCIKDNKDPDEIIEYDYPEEFLQGEIEACKELGIPFEKAVHEQWTDYADQARQTLIHSEPHELLCNLCGGSCWDESGGEYPLHARRGALVLWEPQRR